MRKPLSKNKFFDWERAKAEADSLECEITERMDHILRVWVETFGGHLETWWFDDANEGQVGSLSNHMYPDHSIWGIHLQCITEPVPNDKEEMVILDKDGGEWAWDGSIPLRWLFENCDMEISKGKTLYDEKMEQKRMVAESKKAIKKQADQSMFKLAEQAKAKLSKKELAALKMALK